MPECTSSYMMVAAAGIPAEVGHGAVSSKAAKHQQAAQRQSLKRKQPGPSRDAAAMPAIDVSRAPASGPLKVLTGKPTGGAGRVSAPAVPLVGPVRRGRAGRQAHRA